MKSKTIRMTAAALVLTVFLSGCQKASSGRNAFTDLPDLPITIHKRLDDKPPSLRLLEHQKEVAMRHADTAGEEVTGDDHSEENP